MARVPVHLHAGAFGIFGGRCIAHVLFSKNVFVLEICFFRFAVTDYMYVAASCFHSGRFFWNLFLNCDTGFAFYFERKLYFFLTRKTVFSKKTALSCIFFRISIDNLGPYMCYVNFIQKLLFVKYCLFLIDSLFLLLLMQQEHHYLF